MKIMVQEPSTDSKPNAPELALAKQAPQRETLQAPKEGKKEKPQPRPRLNQIQEEYHEEDYGGREHGTETSGSGSEDDGGFVNPFEEIAKIKAQAEEQMSPQKLEQILAPRLNQMEAFFMSQIANVYKKLEGEVEVISKQAEEDRQATAEADKDVEEDL